MLIQKISKSAIYSALLIAFAIASYAQPKAADSTMRSVDDFKETCQTAGAANKKVVAVFTDNASAGYKLQFPEAVSKFVNANYTVVPVGKGTVPGLDDLFQVSRYPALIIVDATGTEIDRLVSPYQHQDVVMLLRACAMGTSELETLKTSATAPNATAIDRLNLANAYRKRDLSKEAIVEYGRILETESRKNPASASARVFSYAIQQLSEMGKTDTAALEPLRVLRGKVDVNKSIASADAESLQVLFFCNSALGEAAKNVEIFASIPDDNALRQRLFVMAFPALAEARNYAAIVSLVDVETYVNEMYPRFLFEAGHSAQDGHDHSQMEKAINQRIEATTKSGIEVCIGSGQLEKAKRLAGRVLDYTQNKDMGDGLITAAKRANNETLSKEFEDWLRAYVKK